MKKWLCMICVGILITTTTACGSGGSKKLASKEKPTTKEGKTVVTLSQSLSDVFYEAVEKKFEEKYPDIDLQIQAYKQIGEEWGEGDYEKYQKTTNTAVLSGKGADIIDIRSLPIDDYVSKKLLLNMDDFMKQDKTLNKSDLQMNVLEAVKLNGGLYTIPLGFYLRGFVGDGDILKNTNVNVDDKNWTWKEFGEISKELMQEVEKGGKDRRYALANKQPEEILQEMVGDRYTEFVDGAARKAKFDSPVFVELMQQTKKMFDDEVMTSKEVYTGPEDYGNQLFYSMMVFSPADFIHRPHMIFANPKILNKPHGEEETGEMQIFPTTQFAIQAKSSVKEEAWKFIAFLLSEEAQSLQERDQEGLGLSLLKSVNDKELNDIQEQVKSGAFKLSVSDEEFTQFKRFIHTATAVPEAILDEKIFPIISDESKSFFSGQKSAEEVAKLIQNRTTTVLNE